MAETRGLKRQPNFINGLIASHLSARDSMLTQTREGIISRNAPVALVKAGTRLGGSRIAMPWTGDRKKTIKY